MWHTDLPPAPSSRDLLGPWEAGSEGAALPGPGEASRAPSLRSAGEVSRRRARLHAGLGKGCCSRYGGAEAQQSRRTEREGRQRAGCLRPGPDPAEAPRLLPSS